MASIRDYAITVEAVATASMVMAMPVHATGDLLVAFVNKDTNSNFTTPSGWDALQTQVSAGAGGGVYAKRAASAAETVTFTYTSETACGIVIAVRDVYGSSVSDAVSGSAKSGSDDSVLPLAGIGITPSHDNCLLLSGLSTDSGLGPNALPPWVNLFAGDAAANSLCVSYTQQYGSAAAVTAPGHWGNGADDSRAFMVAVRPATTGVTRDGYIPLSTTPARQITPMNGVTGVVDKGAWAAVGVNTITSVNGKTVTGTAIATTADSGINPFRGSARAAGATSKTNYSAVEFNLTATDDITDLGGLIFLTYMNLTPSDYKDCGTPAQGGKYVLFGSDTTNYRAWLVGGRTCPTERADARNNVLIEFATTDTDLVTLGTPAFSALDLIQFGSLGYSVACSMLVNEMYLLDYVTLAGGSAAGYLDLTDLEFVVNNGCGILPLVVVSGVQATLWTALKFGGVDPLFFAEDKKVFAYPQKADGTKYLDFHVSNGKVGIEFDGQDRGGGDVDVLYFTSCLFTSPSPYYWRFASTHDAGADIDFTGSSVINAVVTLRAAVTLADMKFIECGTFTQNAAVISDCAFTETKLSAAALADLENVTSCTFTSGGTGYAIEVGGSADTIDLTNLTFTGYASSSGSTGNEAIYVNISMGTVTLNISGGTVPSIRTAGATVNVVLSATLELTGLQNPTEVRVFDAGTATAITGEENVADGNYSTSIDAATYPSVDISIIALGYQNMRLLAVDMSGGDVSIPVQQALDRQYANP